MLSAALTTRSSVRAVRGAEGGNAALVVDADLIADNDADDDADDDEDMTQT
ncbi:MAG TPA: hypothetical protein VNI01_09195 [Elusimicrobiota bacterium]|jgi:hypothetical protein|nr:hypothetical protein [Elusimicrobiota bacterium]